MTEEIFYAPLAQSRVIQLVEVIALFSDHGFRMKIQEHSADMCWVYSEAFKTQFVVSTTPDEKKEISLVTVELDLEDGKQCRAKIEVILTELGLSCDPNEQYK